MGLSLADRHLLLEAPSPAFPSESRQPVSANVQAREGRERGKAVAGGQGGSGPPSLGLPEHPCSSSEDRLAHTLHTLPLRSQESGGLDRLGEQAPQGP